MNTTPKQQDDGGIAASEGARPTLEQTVMGIAPSTVAPTPAGPPPHLATPTDAPGEADLVIVAAPTIAVADRAPLSSVEAGTPRIDEPARIDAAQTDGSTRPGPAPTGLVASTDLPASADATRTPTLPAPGLGETLPLAWSPPPSPSPEPLEVHERAAAGTAANGTPDHTALSADYLQAARDAALAALANSESRSDESPGDAPSATAALANGSAQTAPMPTPPQAPELDAPSIVDARRSIAAALPGAATAGTERSAPAVARGFEPVPVLRAPLAESLSGALSPIVELGGGHRPMPLSTRPRPQPRRRDSVGRWLLLASVALSTVGVVTLASSLVNRYRNSSARTQAVAAAEGLAAGSDTPLGGSPSAASRALMPNRPAPERATADGRPRVVFATGAPGATVPAEGATTASAGPESQLAAAAGRHVLSGNYAEALPLYRELERTWPENTAYAAMARLLEKRVGSNNDTRTISPTSSPTSPKP
jgi:hypothetical protein